MIFIEFTLKTTKEKALVNINSITCVTPSNPIGFTEIHISSGDCFEVMGGYDKVLEKIADGITFAKDGMVTEHQTEHGRIVRRLKGGTR